MNIDEKNNGSGDFGMIQIDKVLEEFEDESKFIIIDGKSVSVRSVIDRVLSEDKKKKRKLATG